MELDEILKPKPKQKETPFDRFTKEFKKVWEKILALPSSRTRYANAFYETVDGTKEIRVYRHTRNTILARFLAEDCWINEREFYDDLRVFLPQYTEYLLRKKNLISDHWVK